MRVVIQHERKRFVYFLYFDSLKFSSPCALRFDVDYMRRENRTPLLVATYPTHPELPARPLARSPARPPASWPARPPARPLTNHRRQMNASYLSRTGVYPQAHTRPYPPTNANARASDLNTQKTTNYILQQLARFCGRDSGVGGASGGGGGGGGGSGGGASGVGG